MKTLIKLIVTMAITIQLGLSAVGSAQESIVEAKMERHESIMAMIDGVSE